MGDQGGTAALLVLMAGSHTGHLLFILFFLGGEGEVLR